MGRSVLDPLTDSSSEATRAGGSHRSTESTLPTPPAIRAPHHDGEQHIARQRVCFAVLLRRFGDQIDVAACEDLASDAYGLAMAGYNEALGRFGPYYHTIAIHRAQRWLEQRSQERPSSGTTEEENGSGVLDRAPSRYNPWTHAQCTADLKKILGVLRADPSPESQFLLRELDGESHEEIARSTHGEYKTASVATMISERRSELRERYPELVPTRPVGAAPRGRRPKTSLAGESVGSDAVHSSANADFTPFRGGQR